MKTIKNKQGISLIVLVITIIIMIILAAAIIITLSSTGIINQAEKGTNAYSENDLKHKVSLILGDAVVEKVNTRKDIVTYVAEHEEVDEVVDNEETFTIAMDGYIITINKQTLEIEDMAKDTAFRQETRGKASFVLEPATGYSKTVKVSIEVDADLPTGLEVQYNLVESSKDSTNWITYTSGQIAELTKNQTIYGRIINSTTKEIGYSFRKEITAIETEAPKANISLDKTSVATSETVTATVTQSDEKSGIDITKCKYIVNTSSDYLGTDNTSWSSATAFTATPQNISITKTAAGTYYLHVLGVDKCGNMKETVSERIKVKGVVTYLNIKSNFGYAKIMANNNWSVVNSISATRLETVNSAYAVSNNKFNVDDISKITFNLGRAGSGLAGTVGNLILGLVDEKDSNEYVAESVITFGYSDAGAKTMTIDVENLTGEYYIKIFVEKTDTGKEGLYLQGDATVTGEPL